MTRVFQPHFDQSQPGLVTHYEELDMRHCAIRTSPMGDAFVDTCRNCGKAGLTTRDVAYEQCPNPKLWTEDQSLLAAIENGPLDEVIITPPEGMRMLQDGPN